MEARSPLRVSALQALSRKSDADSLRFSGFYAPLTLEDLATALQAAPDSLVLAGGTDVGLWLPSTCATFRHRLHRRIVELRQIHRSGYRVAHRCRGDPDGSLGGLGGRVSGAHELARRFASPPCLQLRDARGNVANGSPIGIPCPP